MFRLDAGVWLFFGLYYLYTWLIIDPRFIDHGIGIISNCFPFSFSTGWPFFREHLSRPGGLVEYGGRFLSQFYQFGWLGAGVITALAVYASLCTDILTRLGGRPRGMVTRYVPAVLLLVIHGGYSQPLRTLLSLLAALSWFLVYSRLTPRHWIGGVVIVAITCPILYYGAGAGGLLFPVLVTIFEIRAKRQTALPVAAAALICGLAVPWIIGKAVCGVDCSLAYGRFLVLDPGIWREWPLAIVLYLFFPAVLAYGLGWLGSVDRGNSGSPDHASSTNGVSQTEKGFRFPWLGKPHWTIQIAVALAGLGAVGWYSLNGDTKAVLKIDYHAQQGNWTAVLDAADEMPYGTSSIRSNRNILLALYHTGRLGDQMFRYPQRSLADLFDAPPGVWNAGSFFQVSRLFLDLGHVNMAQKYAYEALEMTGHLPALLEHLAVIHLVKNGPETARIFLNALEKNPFHRKTAREWLRWLDEDPRLEDNQRVRSIRQAMVSRDSVATDTTAEGFLLALLEEDPGNKMAFEFLMACYLCDRRTEDVVASIGRLPDFGYSEIPRHYQEAIIVYSAITGRVPAIGGYGLDAAVVERAKEFWHIMANTANQEEAAARALSAGFGDTYFFYFSFGGSGL